MMFKFNELRQIHLEITNNCQASCPMCNRNINGGVDNPLIRIQSWTVDDFKQIINQHVLSQIDTFYFCGNFGDPILNNDLIKMCEYSKEVSPHTMITIHTNGGARATSWWTELANAMPSNHLVWFALDGLEDTHHLYRVGTKFNTIIENAKAFMAAGGRANWVFIRFKHNQHQVEAAREMAAELGFENFIVKDSSRFILEPKVKVVNKKNELMHYIEPATDTPLQFIDKKIIDKYKEIAKSSVIDCRVVQDKSVYIDAYKNLYPCCWIASVPYSFIDADDAFAVRAEMYNQHIELMNKLGDTNVINRSIEEIMNSHAYQTVWEEYWTTNKLITCARTCGITDIKFAQPKDQIQK